MLDKPGLVIFTERLGADPNDHSGGDYREWSEKEFTVLTRLNYGYYPDGTIPEIGMYGDFAQRVENYVRASEGCWLWGLGNEMNHPQEWPQGEKIVPVDYADLYWDCITRIPSEHKLLVGAVAPWNDQYGIPWLDYFSHVLSEIGLWGTPDGILLHAYTHGADPDLIYSTVTMDPPYQDMFYHFRHFEQFIERIPHEWATDLYITEANQTGPWIDRPNTWVREMYRYVDTWNKRNSFRPIKGVALFRYPRFDKWYIEGLGNVMEDFRRTVDIGYTWGEEGSEDMWNVIYQSSMTMFYDYMGAGELTVPVGSIPLWEWDPQNDARLNRPEYDHKKSPQPEVRTPPMSAAFFGAHATMQGALVWEIRAPPGSTVRASIWAMGIDGGGDVGQVLGIATQDPGSGPTVPRTLDGKAQWGGWWSHNMEEWVEREWRQIWSPIVQTVQDRFWVVARGVTNWPNWGHTHWDDLVVEVEGDVVIPPGECDCPTAEEIRQIVREELRNLDISIL